MLPLELVVEIAALYFVVLAVFMLGLGVGVCYGIVRRPSLPKEPEPETHTYAPDTIGQVLAEQGKALSYHLAWLAETGSPHARDDANDAIRIMRELLAAAEQRMRQ